MALYCTLDAAKDILGTVNQQVTTTATINNNLVLSSLRVITQRINNTFPQTPRFLPKFEPYYATLTFPLNGNYTNTRLNTFTFPNDLLELTALTINGTLVTAGTAQGYPNASQPPWNTIQLTDFYNNWYFYCGTVTRTPMVSITGWWGFSTDYASAWANLDTLAANVTTTTATSITLTNVDAVGIYGYGVAVSAGNLIRIDTELMEVLTTNTTTNVITVRRGVNGSTAATHTAAAAVYVWQVESAVERAVARQQGLLYARMGAYVTSEVSQMGVEVRYPADFLTEVWGVLQNYQYT